MTDQSDHWSNNPRRNCNGAKLTDWLPDKLPKSEPMRSILAQSMCSGCPVFYECGLDVLEHQTHGVIQAGQALHDNRGPTLWAQYNVIRMQRGLPIPEEEPEGESAGWPRECTRCGATMRPKAEPLDQWPGTVAAHNRFACNTCHSREYVAAHHEENENDDGPERVQELDRHPTVCEG